MSFRSARDVLSKVRVLETGGPRQNGRLMIHVDHLSPRMSAMEIGKCLLPRQGCDRNERRSSRLLPLALQRIQARGCFRDAVISAEPSRPRGVFQPTARVWLIRALQLLQNEATPNGDAKHSWARVYDAMRMLRLHEFGLSDAPPLLFTASSWRTQDEA